MNNGDDDPGILAPDDAFAVLGNETRIQILQTLGEADGKLTFSELRDRVGLSDSGQFSYHLNKLSEHFVCKSGGSYELRQPGRRVVEAVLSGAVTDTPVLEPTEIDQTCHYCDAPIEVTFREERVTNYCTECLGAKAEPNSPANYGYLGALPLPSAGLQGRTAPEVFEAAWVWGNLEFLSSASGVCPRCSAAIERSVSICEEHGTADGLCDECDRRHSVQFHTHCTNCIHGIDRSPFVLGLLANTDLLAFLSTRGLNPVSPSWESISEIDQVHMNYDEKIVSVEPFEARFTFTIDDDALTLTVDDDLNVADVTEH